MDSSQQTAQETEHKAPLYFVVIDGVEHIWHQSVITVPEIASLGGFDPKAGVIEIDADNRERTIGPDEVVALKPGQGFAKKHRFKRGCRT